MSAPERIRKGAATRLGITLVEYDAHLAAGERWCTEGREWHSAGDFTPSGKWCARLGRHAGDPPGLLARTRRDQERNDRLARLLVK